MTNRAAKIASDIPLDATTPQPGGTSYQVLNPRTLGRPVHLIDKFAAQIREDLAERFCAALNRRYRANFVVGPVSLTHFGPEHDPPLHRLNYRTAAGLMGFALDREVLLCILRYRFGTHGESAPSPEPASASEERLATQLGSQLVSIVADRVETQPRASDTNEPTGAPAAETSSGVPTDDSWILRADITERTRGTQGALWFLLDAACIERLLSGLSSSRTRAASPKAPVSDLPLPGGLQFTLTARLLDTEIPLGLLLDSSIGDVIPVSLRGADVLIGGSRLFTASVAENRGKLCLTSFVDVE